MPANDVRGRSQRKRRGNREAAIAGGESASARGDDVQAREGMTEDLVDAGVAEQLVETAQQHVRHLARVRLGRIPLLVDVGVMTARECRNRIALGQARHAPAPDG